MMDALFLKKLQKEMPLWLEKGWMEQGNRNAIIDDLAQRGNLASRAPLAFAILGVLVFGAGIILLFAANWQVMPKLLKMSILFGAMILSYAAAGFAIARHNGAGNKIAHALLLMGVILFGANIILIAQIYHIDRHYPDGILVWALGALLVAYLIPSQPAAIAALLLALLWSGMEIFGFYQQFHWPFLLFCLMVVPAIWRCNWLGASRISILVLIIWSILNLRYWGNPKTTFFLQVDFLAFMALFCISQILERYGLSARLTASVKRLSLIGALLPFFALTFRGFHGVGQSSDRYQTADSTWILVTAIAMVIATAVLIWGRRQFMTDRNKAIALSRQILYLLVLSAMFANLFRGLEGISATGMYLAFNVLYFASLAWLIYSGFHAGDSYRVNSAFVFFAVGIIILYFDTFWTLSDRAYFFLGGGVILFGGGYLLERQRRRIISLTPDSNVPRGSS